MSRFHLLYLTLNEKETKLGWILLPIYFTLSLGLGFWDGLEFSLLLPVFSLLSFLCVLYLFRDFWKRTREDIFLSGWQLLWKPLLALALSKVVQVAFDDLLLLYYLPQYFEMTGWGPMLWDIRSAATEMAAAKNLLLTALVMILMMPVVEELLFRGVVFGTLYSRNNVLAVCLSVLLYALFRALPYAPVLNDTRYLIIYFVQQIPPALFLCWLYTSTDSLLGPILMHVLLNAALVFPSP